ncbi:hypothetical protein MKX03_009507 [Papaver bracteatum]|nr:hypothetical protein MKX03_009507 [Papaver bracteatum]
MPPVYSPLIRPGRPAEEAPGISKQKSDVIISASFLLKPHEPIQSSQQVYLGRP